MLILPAIDLIEGGCVRLLHGRFDQATRYGDPVEQIAAFAAAGASWVHVVDLDGAKAGAPRQTELIAQLASAGVKLQSGGGVRTRTDIALLLDSGVARVVVGSAAARDPELARGWLREFGAERICGAFDVCRSASGYEVVAEAWREGAGVELTALLARFGEELIHALITDISRDGAMTGPNTELIASVTRANPHLQVQGSGGVSSLADLTALREAGAAGAIVGRALYERAFTLEDALAG
jgi:phosphoribosylformimino-5-aminoimidazole carboxamide ribotide isomerase